MEIVFAVVGLLVGAGLVYFILSGQSNSKVKAAQAQVESAQAEAERITSEAARQAENAKKDAVIEAKEHIAEAKKLDVTNFAVAMFEEFCK